MSNARKPGRPRDPAVDEAILAEAFRLLGEKGYGGMSVDAVAVAAGVGKSTVYRRYATKADLATAALASLIDADALPPDDLEVEAALSWVLESLAQRLRDPHSMALVGTLLTEEERNPNLIALFRKRVWDRRVDHLRRVLEGAQTRGEVCSTVDSEAVIGMLIGSLYAAYIGQAKIPRDWPARIVRTALGGIRGEPRARS